MNYSKMTLFFAL